MQEINQINIQQENEISLKELILRLITWGRYLLNKWLIIVIFGLIGAVLGFTYALLKRTEYVAELTFVVEDSKAGNPLSGYMGLASQFGIDLGAASSSGIFEGNNILEFLKSRLMIERTLLSVVKVNNERKSLADLYIEIYGLNKVWEEKPSLARLHFPVDISRSKFSLQQDSILNVLHERIIKKNLEVKKPDKKLNFISVKCTSRDQLFSKLFTERLVQEATDFYIKTKVKRSQANVDKLQATADSLEILLNRRTYSLAAVKDLNQNPAKQVASVSSELQSRDKMVLQTIYTEVVKNLEISKMTMAQETPIVQVIDAPILPLKEEKIGRITGGVLGGGLCVFFTVLWLTVRRLYEQIMR